MRRLFVRPEQLAEASIALDAAQARHLVQVLRLGDGAEVEVFDGTGRRARTILRGATLGLDGPIEERAPGPVTITLAQALVKNDKLDLVIQKATELGAASVVVYEAERSVVRLSAERGEKKARRWEKIAQEAARQCGRADVPTIEGPVRFEALAARAQADVAVVLDTGADLPRLSQVAAGATSVLVCIGPEGGLSANELAALEGAGFLRASLGPLVLRTETAGLAALAVLRHLSGELG